MSDNDEIEKLRAALIVDRAIIQAILEELPVETLNAINTNIKFKLEHFTVRAMYSTMPEPFVQAQRDSANAWLSLVQDTINKRKSSRIL